MFALVTLAPPTLSIAFAGSAYTFTWANVQAGTYQITAKAIDNVGGASVTSANTVTVLAGEAQVYFIHPDHLGTPRAITKAADNAIVWKWDHTDPFGANTPNENPSGLGSFSFNLRFPGQYYDAETGTHYNYFRDYDPSTGRYMQSDPTGLQGGLTPTAMSRAVRLPIRTRWGLKLPCALNLFMLSARSGGLAFIRKANGTLHRFIISLFVFLMGKAELLAVDKTEKTVPLARANAAMTSTIPSSARRLTMISASRTVC